jgi:two-component system sensor histidine kinase UhpB
MRYIKNKNIFLNNRQNSFSLSIYQKIAIGNSLIIIIGAVGGTFLTRHLTNKAADIWLILFFATLGISVSVLANFWILKSALKPIRDLRNLVDHLQVNHPLVKTKSIIRDPDISQLAQVLDSLIRQLEERTTQLNAFNELKINTQEEERKRIARSLHDDTGQALSTMLIHLDYLEKHLPNLDHKLRDKLSQTKKLAADSLLELRKIIYDLRPTILDDLGLAAAIRSYANKNFVQAGIKLKVTVSDTLSEIPEDLSSNLFRISQEVINNIVRHSKARNAEITLIQEDDHISLRINDDGQGFNVDEVLGQVMQAQQWGLSGIKERSELLGGKVEINSKKEAGTKIQVDIPIRSQMRE